MMIISLLSQGKDCFNYAKMDVFSRKMYISYIDREKAFIDKVSGTIYAL